MHEAEKALEKALDGPLRSPAPSYTETMAQPGTRVPPAEQAEVAKPEPKGEAEAKLGAEAEVKAKVETEEEEKNGVVAEAEAAVVERKRRIFSI